MSNAYDVIVIGAGRVGHWRCDRQVHAGARGLGAGDCVRREHGKSPHCEIGLCCHASRDVFSSPGGSFGLTEKQAREKGHDVKVARFNFQANGKALGLGDYQGFVKIVTDSRYGEILSAHLIGPEVTELLPELTLAHSAELTIEEIAHNVHAHPSLSEVIMEAAHGLTGGYIQS